ncbi:MAG: helix-turn-helix transcriptional regulator [Saprospiraceae bacterium]|nr:helix-turn-helix transcriptional regulator [Saprospiraceae bacterium]
MRIGKNLIRYRFAKGWSQEDLAREVGMSQGNYSKIESDRQECLAGANRGFCKGIGSGSCHAYRS